MPGVISCMLSVVILGRKLVTPSEVIIETDISPQIQTTDSHKKCEV